MRGFGLKQGFVSATGKLLARHVFCFFNNINVYFASSGLKQNAVGKWSSKLFARALLASGQSSTITGTYAGQYVMQGFLDLRLEPWLRNFLTRCLAIIPSLVVAIIGGSAGAGKLIIIASVTQSYPISNHMLYDLLHHIKSLTEWTLNRWSYPLSSRLR